MIKFFFAVFLLFPFQTSNAAEVKWLAAYLDCLQLFKEVKTAPKKLTVRNDVSSGLPAEQWGKTTAILGQRGRKKGVWLIDSGSAFFVPINEMKDQKLVKIGDDLGNATSETPVVIKKFTTLVKVRGREPISLTVTLFERSQKAEIVIDSPSEATSKTNQPPTQYALMEVSEGLMSQLKKEVLARGQELNLRSNSSLNKKIQLDASGHREDLFQPIIEALDECRIRLPKDDVVEKASLQEVIDSLKRSTNYYKSPYYPEKIEGRPKNGDTAI